MSGWIVWLIAIAIGAVGVNIGTAYGGFVVGVAIGIGTIAGRMWERDDA